MKRASHGMTQRASIKKFLESGQSITALEALSLFGAYRLAAQIHFLREKQGMAIVTTMNKDVTGRTYARYSLANPVLRGVITSSMSKPTYKAGDAYAH